MHALELPHARNCLVCGRNNPQGLRLCLHVIPDTGLVSTEYLAEPEHVGFEGMIHGGLLATILDEAMTWAATWKQKRFCFCGELTARFRHPVKPGQALRVEAVAEFSRPKLVEVTCKMFDFTGRVVATGSGKYIPATPQQHVEHLASFVEHPHTTEAARLLAVGYDALVKG
jgi:acyl-coenzyme A thioesterase PaaI-like protein